MKKSIALAALALAVAAPAMAAGEDSGSWLIRARALRLISDNGGSTTPDLKLSVNDKTFLELDFSYFFTPNIAAELVTTYPQKHRIYSDGTRIGSLKHFPPTLLGQYHFTGLSGVRPYVGAGLNLTRFSSVKWDPAVQEALDPGIQRTSLGLALQVGADVPVGGGWSINLDAKYVKLDTKVRSGASTIGTFNVDPYLLSVGIGKRF